MQRRRLLTGGVPILAEPELQQGLHNVSQFNKTGALSDIASQRGPRSPDFRHKQACHAEQQGMHNAPQFDKTIALSDIALQSGRMSPNFRYKHTRQAYDQPSIQEEEELRQKMHQEFMDSIKACGRQKDLLKGRKIHADILEAGLLKSDICISTALIRMYAKCGALEKAQEVFDGLPLWNAVSWNALITGYAQHGLGEEAFNCFRQMQYEGFSPDTVTFICMLKACSSIEQGAELHAEVRRLGLLKNHDIRLSNALVSMYAKCGALDTAQQVFDGLPLRDAISWNVLISGYVQHALYEEALNCFGWMQKEGFSPNTVTFLCVLKACGSIGATEKGEEIHAEVRRLGLLENHDIVLGTALVNMYSKCGATAKAQEVFDRLPRQDAISWNVLIAGYAQHGLGEEAFNCFGRMQAEGFPPDAVTFACILKACGSIRAIEKGREIHAELHSMGLLQTRETVLGNALVDMYVKCGALARAQEVFDGLPIRDAVSWTALIAGYAQHGLGEEALDCFGWMQDEGFSPDAVTFVCILKACGSIGAIERGEEIHAEVRRLGLSENQNIVLGTALVDMYAKCGALAKAQEVLDGLPVQNVVCWNALIAGYAQHGYSEEALNCFGRMQDEGFSPDAVTFACILKACGSIGATEKGEQIHAEVHRLMLMESHQIILSNALVDMYAKCGAVAKAQEVFDGLPIRDAFSWNALIGGYAQHGFAEEALSCFGQMRNEGFSPDTVTFICILKACGSIGAMEVGEEIHAEIRRLDLLGKHDVVLGTALVDMYTKCGALAKAQQVFDGLPVRNTVSWNALMAGYARLDKAERVFELFSKMIGEYLEPDGVTFCILLTACSHAGLVEEGQRYFDMISTVYCIILSPEHYTCLVDLFSRAGHFDKAISVIEKVQDSDLWLPLSSACQNWVNVELGRWAYDHALEFDDNCAAAYVCMSNIYAAAGMQEEADKVEALRTKNAAWKLPGCCWWTDLGGNVHSFTVGDKGHPEINFIFSKLKVIWQKLRLEGYSPHLHWVSQAMSENKEDVLCGHIGKLVI